MAVCAMRADLGSGERPAAFQRGCTVSLPRSVWELQLPVSLSLSHLGRWTGVQRRLVWLWVATPAASLCDSLALISSG